MGYRLTLNAPAKVNLHLEILGRRPDGYHEILSIFQAVSLYDGVRLRSLTSREDLRLKCSVPIPQQANTVTRAVELFRRATGINQGIGIELDKRIPLGAGLGGGSSDAAAVLAGINSLFGAPLGAEALLRLAAQLGSDVPFFLGRGAALVSGRGERVKSLVSRQDFLLLLVYPGFAVLTREAYGWFDAEAGAVSGVRMPAEELQARYLSKPVADWGFLNSFRPVVEKRFPIIGELIRGLAGFGACFTGLSGSGSAVFGAFTESAAARKALRYYRRICPMAVLSKPLHNEG